MYNSRRSRQFDLIEDFLSSTRQSIVLRLYTKEVVKLRKEYPQLLVHKIATYTDNTSAYQFDKKIII